MTVFAQRALGWSQTKGEGGIKTPGLLRECIAASAHVFADEVNARLPIWDRPKCNGCYAGLIHVLLVADITDYIYTYRLCIM